MRTLTEGFLERLAATPAPDRDIEIASDSGLSIRRRARSGVITFQTRYRHGGRTRRLSIGQWPALPLKEAQKIARKAMAEVAGGADPIQRRREAEARERTQATFGELAAAYVAHLRAGGARSVRGIENRIKRDLSAELGVRKARDITQADVFRTVEKVRVRGANVAANRTYSLIVAIMRYGVSRGDVLVNPCAAIRRKHIVTPEAGRSRVLSDDEIRRLFDDVGPQSPVFALTDRRFTQILRLLLLCGARCGELMKARVEEFDLDSATWTIPPEHAKNGKEHVIYLSAAAVAIVRDLMEMPAALGSQHLLVSLARSNVDRPLTHSALEWSTAKIWKATGIEGATVHDLRRTHRTLLARLGVPFDVAERALGHRIDGLIKIYDRHGYEKELHDASEKVSAYVSGLASGKVVDIGAKRSA